MSYGARHGGRWGTLLLDCRATHDKTFSLHDLTLTYHLSSFNNTSDLLFLLSALAWRASWYLLYTHSNCLLVPLIKNIPLFDAIVDICLRLHRYCQPNCGPASPGPPVDRPGSYLDLYRHAMVAHSDYISSTPTHAVTLALLDLAVDLLSTVLSMEAGALQCSCVRAKVIGREMKNS